MEPRRINAFAVHLCADATTRGVRTSWPPSVFARDTVRRAERICAHIGIAEQWILSGSHATAAALIDAILHASKVLDADGLFVLTFSGHTERGNGPINTTRWCLVDGGLTLLRIARQLSLLPIASKLIIICDTCYAAAITKIPLGPQRISVFAGCGSDQTIIERPRSIFMLKLEGFFCSSRAQGSLGELRTLLEADTPDCERPVIWTNNEHAYSIDAITGLVGPSTLASGRPVPAAAY